MRSIYLDNGATSFPKAPGVAEAMMHYIRDVGANINRGSYAQALDAGTVVLETRRQLARIFHFTGPESHVVFTPGATYGLNQLLRGFLSAGDHVIVSSLEHNAVLRPLHELEMAGVSVSVIPADAEGRTDPDDIRPLMQAATKLVLVCHASNVSGNLFPLEAVAKLCREEGISLAVDAAQTAGHYPIDFEELHLAALCVPGHKGLLGPQGIGALLLAPEFARKLRPIVTGGTGSISDQVVQPEFLPDRFESGTPNLPGIFGLHAALTYIEEKGIPFFQHREAKLAERLVQGLQGLPLRILGAGAPRVGVVSIDFADIDNGTASFQLEDTYGILTRCGLQCAPQAHHTLGSFPEGSVRFSIGYATTEEEIDKTIQAVREICGTR